ncbi:MAG: signal peptidase I [Sulfolobales archaeon]|nr:signal peptidase I [Sulfolobales archaeon]
MRRKLLPILGNTIAILLFVVVLLNVSGVIILGTVEGPSMEPLFQTGDLVIIVKSAEIGVGDIIIYKKKVGDGFIIHRVIDVYIIRGEQYYVTKGDNNALPDYQEFEVVGVPASRIVGKVLEVNDYPVKIPIVGYLSLLTRRLLSQH